MGVLACSFFQSTSPQFVEQWTKVPLNEIFESKLLFHMLFSEAADQLALHSWEKLYIQCLAPSRCNPHSQLYLDFV